MLSDSDLDAAVAAGALSPEAAARLRSFVARQASIPTADEENFRLITGFNDIFVSLAAVLLLLALVWLGRLVSPEFGSAAIAAASWGLAEYFTRRRRMALPSIVLLLSFVIGVFSFGSILFAVRSPAIALSRPTTAMAVGAALAVIAAYAHWRRFMVPITVAAGAAAAIAMTLAMLLGLDPELRFWLHPMLLCSGLVVFALAMYWDASDRTRLTRRSDVGFWLHLLAAPMIIHPAFTMLGLTGGSGTTVPRAAAAVGLYVVLALVALLIDRRAVLVSALGYVLYALSALFRAASSLNESFALTVLILGSLLLLLSAFWHPVRKAAMGPLPAAIRARLPAV